ncbi:hypothetical protein SPHV1_2290027 [Novosphingobium sp. KN65.2]|nr:hypothetical protein SPHV1_2290027 [Novosphingobium sp. KN65.2]
MDEALQYFANQIGAQQLALYTLIHALDHAGAINSDAFATAVKEFGQKCAPHLKETIDEFCLGIRSEDVRPQFAIIDGGKEQDREQSVDNDDGG